MIAFTIVQDEAIFLPLWLEYYQGQGLDTLVLDNDTRDGSTDGITARVVTHPKGKTNDHKWLRATVMATLSDLLQEHEVVVFAEADEFLMPKRGTLKSYMEHRTAPRMRATGYEVIHPPNEPPLCWEQRPLLEQRTRWWRNDLWDKTLISEIPLSWEIGFHTVLDIPEVKPDPNLFLVHLHRIDLDSCVARHHKRKGRDWNENDLKNGWGKQNRLVDIQDATFHDWFYQGMDDSESIPPEVQSRL